MIVTMKNVSCYLYNNAISIDYEHNFRVGSNHLTGIASHLQLPDHSRRYRLEFGLNSYSKRFFLCLCDVFICSKRTLKPYKHSIDYTETTQ